MPQSLSGIVGDNVKNADVGADVGPEVVCPATSLSTLKPTAITRQFTRSRAWHLDSLLCTFHTHCNDGPHLLMAETIPRLGFKIKVLFVCTSAVSCSRPCLLPHQLVPSPSLPQTTIQNSLTFLVESDHFELNIARSRFHDRFCSLCYEPKSFEPDELVDSLQLLLSFFIKYCTYNIIHGIPFLHV